jgi:hypothetical protein
VPPQCRPRRVAADGGFTAPQSSRAAGAPPVRSLSSPCPHSQTWTARNRPPASWRNP